MSLTLGIDIGTSGIRSAVLDDDGAVLCMARADHLAQNPESIDADLWWLATKRCLEHQRSALAGIGRSMSDITRLAIDGTSGTMVLTDANLNPVTRALMYDSNGFVAEANEIDRVAPGVHIALGSSSAPARAMHLVAEDADGSAVHLSHQADFVAAKLLGHGGVSDVNNALKTGCDPETCEWPAWITDACLSSHILPEIVPAGQPIGFVTNHVAQDLGLSPKAIVHAGTTDSIAAFLAAAPMDPGVAVTSLGSTISIKIVADTRIDDPSIGLYSHKLGDNWLAGGASNSGGRVLQEYFSFEELSRLSKKINASVSSNLNYYPLQQPGERFPFNDPEFAPKLTPRPENDADFLMGMLEGMAAIELACYTAISDRGGQPPRHLYTAGGGAANATWTAIRERVLGMKIEKATHSEAAVGTAKLVLG